MHSVGQAKAKYCFCFMFKLLTYFIILASYLPPVSRISRHPFLFPTPGMFVVAAEPLSLNILKLGVLFETGRL